MNVKKIVSVILIAITLLVIVSFILISTNHNKVEQKFMVVYLIRSNEKFNFTDLTHGSPNDPYHIYTFSEGNTSLAVSPFLWNLYFSNKILMNLTFNGKYFNVSIMAINISYISPSIHVLGYPGFMYGYETWFPFSEMGKTKEYGLYLPEKLSNLSNFYSFLYYTVWNVTGRIDDFSYDIWLTPQPNVPQLSKGDIEVMIWNYWGQNLSSVPYFVYIGNAHFPTYINGTIKNVSYSIHILNYTGSMNGWTGVYYLMQDHGIKSGTVGIPITLILQYTAKLLMQKDGYIANISNYYMDAIQVGMETYGKSVMAGYYLYGWWLNISV